MKDFSMVDGGSILGPNDRTRDLSWEACWLQMNTQFAGQKLSAEETAHIAFLRGRELRNYDRGARETRSFFYGIVGGLIIAAAVGTVISLCAR